MPKRILLADDSITIQKVVELTFSDGDYEVVAVNNGARAIAKLSEMRPDVILSDIIMPEKNGYEVCEYVKSHPEFRNIPVVLLTGTFEPFDPDRADKAGCDAVVTKPFESQSLIHKVEELIEQARSNAASVQAPPPPPAPAPAPSPWEEAAPPAGNVSSFGGFEAAGGFTPAEPQAFSTAVFAPQSNDIFQAAPAAAPTPTVDMPFEPPAAPAAIPPPSSFTPPSFSPSVGAFGGETRAIPPLSFDESPMEPASAPAAPEPSSPWDEVPESGGETKAFPRMSFAERQQMGTSAPAAPPASPWDEPQADAFAPAPDEEPLASSSATGPAPTTDSPWGEPAVAEGETRAFTRMSFDDLQNMNSGAAPSTPEPEPVPAPAPSPWDEPDAGGETRAFSRMTFEDLQRQEAAAAAPAPQPDSPWSEPATATPSWATASEPEPASPDVESFTDMAAPPFEARGAEPSPFESAAEPAVESQFETAPEPVVEELPSAPQAPTVPDESSSWAARAAASETSTPAPVAFDPAHLSEEQIDRIARRVVELMSEQVVRNIAWEVIPDVAEMVVKERIRQLEAEA
jgi:CheY-like chemotaxis protein